MNATALLIELRKRSQRLRNPEETPSTIGDLADDGELLLVLARIVGGTDLERAFGSPGDWGYSHPIGRAIAEKGGAMAATSQGDGDPREVALLLLLDSIDYESGNCRVNEMIGAVLLVEILRRAKKAVKR